MQKKCKAVKLDDNDWWHRCTKAKGHDGRHYCGRCWFRFQERIFWKKRAAALTRRESVK